MNTHGTAYIFRKWYVYVEPKIPVYTLLVLTVALDRVKSSVIRSFIVRPDVKYGPGSSVGIATDYGLDGPVSNPGGTRFSLIQTGPGAHPAPCKMGTGSFPGVKCGRGVLLTTHPLLVPRS